jgi:hypothetical protein
MGYSAAGQYLPVVAKLVLEGTLPLTLRGIAMGNGLIDPLTQIPTWGEFLHENKLINATTLARFNRQYRFGCERALLQGNWSAANDECWALSSYCPTPDNLNIHGALHSHDIIDCPGNNDLFCLLAVLIRPLLMGSSDNAIRWQPAGVPELLSQRCHKTHTTRGKRFFRLELLQLNRLSAVQPGSCAIVSLDTGDEMGRTSCAGGRTAAPLDACEYTY